MLDLALSDFAQGLLIAGGVLVAIVVWTLRDLRAEKAPRTVGPVREFASAMGAAKGAPTEPLVFFGHLGTSDELPELMSRQSTLCTAAIVDLLSFEAWLASHEPVALVAMSRPENPGEAGRAIAALKKKYPTGRAALYHAWDYNVERGAKRAIEYGADGLVMPAMELNDMFRVLFAVMQRAGEGTPPPASVEAHAALLEEHAPGSPFWGLQDKVTSPYF